MVFLFGEECILRLQIKKIKMASKKFVFPLALFVFISFSSALLAQSSMLSKQDACAVLSKESIANMMSVDVNDLVEEDMSFLENDRRSICHLVVKGQIASCNVRLSWSSERAQENKALERQFNQYLSNGEQTMKKYEEINNDDNGQVLFGMEKGENGVLYVVRKRYGLSADAKIEVLMPTEGEAVREKLLATIERLH